MKIGDLVRRKDAGWLALILSLDEHNMTVEFMWLTGDSYHGKVENCSMSLLEVISESG